MPISLVIFTIERGIFSPIIRILRMQSLKLPHNNHRHLLHFQAPEPQKNGITTSSFCKISALFASVFTNQKNRKQLSIKAKPIYTKTENIPAHVNIV